METQKYNISNGVGKIENNVRYSAYILDLSTVLKNEGGTRQKDSAVGALISAKIATQKAPFSYKKIIVSFLIAAILDLSILGVSFWKELGHIKATAFGASAMSEENIAAIEKYLKIIQYMPNFGATQKIKELALDFESFKNILGFDRPKKYLLIFQNPSEMRATGGFIGSIGVLEMESGKVKGVKLKDVYDLDGQLKILVEPPGPIKKISAAWSLHDSNWFFDFPRSAEKISWFYEKGGGETMDGVVALGPKVVQDILKVTGPVRMDGYNTEIDEKNFIETAQAETEISYDKTINRPKLFLAELLGKLKETVEGLPLDKKIIIMKNLIDNLDNKDIQMVFNNESAESFVSSHHWDGRVNETGGDYLAVVSSNINGFKTDAVIGETLNLVTEISADGSVVDNLTIVRAHNGSADSADWYNRVNSNYLRLFVPSGSEFLEAKGMVRETPFFKDPAANYGEYLKDEDVEQLERNKLVDAQTGTEIFEESGKTVFGSWMYISPGEKTVVSYRYRLPFKIEFNESTRTGSYTLLFQKQSGSKTAILNQTIIFPKSWKLADSYSDFTLGDGKAERMLDIKNDKFEAILFSNK